MKRSLSPSKDRGKDFVTTTDVRYYEASSFSHKDFENRRDIIDCITTSECNVEGSRLVVRTLYPGVHRSTKIRYKFYVKTIHSSYCPSKRSNSNQGLASTPISFLPADCRSFCLTSFIFSSKTIQHEPIRKRSSPGLYCQACKSK
jgi:hypothetical protein